MRYIRIAFSRYIQFFRNLVEVRSVRDFLELIKEFFILSLYETHYGCPNSRRTKKLQLKKVLFR